MTATTRRHLTVAASEPRGNPMLDRAKRLYPDNVTLQREWIRAVSVVRRTRKGWLLERELHRAGA